MFGSTLKKLRLENDLTQQQLADKLGISRSAIGMYENGDREPDFETLEIIADFFNVKLDYLMGRDKGEITSLPNENVCLCPLFDSISAGFGAIPNDNILSYVPTYISNPMEQNQYIWVNVKGDSMSPLIDDGAQVLIRKQESVDSGQIAAVLVDGEEAFVKRVEYDKDSITLISANPYYPPKKFEGSEVLRVRILGLVKKVSKDLN